MNCRLWMDGGAASLVAMTGERVLTGSTFALADEVDPAVADALRAAGAEPALGGSPNVAVGPPPSPAAVTITSARHPAVSAVDVALANAASTVVVTAMPRTWPADVRFAAPPRPVVAVPTNPSDYDDGDRLALASAVDALRAAGARLVALDTETRTAEGAFAEGADVVLGLKGSRDGLCSVTVPVVGRPVAVLARRFDDAVALDVAAIVAGVPAPECPWPLAAAEHTELVVFGAHLRGGPLEHQLTDLGARWAGELTTSDRYRMTRLPTTPPKPAVTRVPDDAKGTAMKGQRWLLSPAGLGRFLVALPAPMQLGKVEFSDGSWRTSFGCDGVAAEAGVDISRFGGWEAAIAAGAVT